MTKTFIHPAITQSVASLRQSDADRRPTFEQDQEETIVLFRKSRRKEPAGLEAEVTAVFPCEPATITGETMTCYAHMGQHGACDLGWYHTTHAAKPEEYASLQRELEGAPYGYRLKIARRMTRAMHGKRKAEARRLRDAGNV